MKKALLRIVLVVAVAGAGYGIYRFIQGLPSRQEAVPTTRVRQGDVVVRSFARGELRAVRSATLTAPNLFGTVQVTRLAPMGAFAREKDLIVEFDDSEVLSRLEQRQHLVGEVEQAQEVRDRDPAAADAPAGRSSAVVIASSVAASLAGKTAERALSGQRRRAPRPRLPAERPGPRCPDSLAGERADG